MNDTVSERAFWTAVFYTLLKEQGYALEAAIAGADQAVAARNQAAPDFYPRPSFRADA